LPPVGRFLESAVVLGNEGVLIEVGDNAVVVDGLIRMVDFEISISSVVMSSEMSSKSGVVM